MSENRYHTLRSILAMISLLVLVSLMSGYFGFGGKIHVFGSSPAIGRIEYFHFSFGQGRATLSFDLESSGASAAKFGYGLFWDPPEFSQSFRRGFTFAAEGSHHGIKRLEVLIIIFPIWFVILPCSVAPLMWLRQRRRTTSVGFGVIATVKN